MRIEAPLVGVEIETKIRDIQALVRRTPQRERDGGVDEIVIVLANTRTNRALVAELRTALGERFQTQPRAILLALRRGRADSRLGSDRRVTATWRIDDLAGLPAVQHP